MFREFVDSREGFEQEEEAAQKWIREFASYEDSCEYDYYWAGLEDFGCDHVCEVEG